MTGGIGTRAYVLTDDGPSYPQVPDLITVALPLVSVIETGGGTKLIPDALADKLDRRMLVRSGPPTAADIPAGTVRVVKDTVTGRRSLFVNDGGTIIDLINGQEF